MCFEEGKISLKKEKITFLSNDVKKILWDNLQLNKQLEVKRKMQTHFKKHLIRIFSFNFMFQKICIIFRKADKS